MAIKKDPNDKHKIIVDEPVRPNNLKKMFSLALYR